MPQKTCIMSDSLWSFFKLFIVDHCFAKVHIICFQYIFASHIHSLWEGSVFSLVCLSVHGVQGVGGGLPMCHYPLYHSPVIDHMGTPIQTYSLWDPSPPELFKLVHLGPPFLRSSIGLQLRGLLVECIWEKTVVITRNQSVCRQTYVNI